MGAKKYSDKVKAVVKDKYNKIAKKIKNMREKKRQKANSLLTGDVKKITGMTKSQLEDNLPKGWSYHEHNGRIHIKDSTVVPPRVRIRIDPLDRRTNYRHIHVYDNKGNPLDINGNIVGGKDPKGHIPYDD